MTTKEILLNARTACAALRAADTETKNAALRAKGEFEKADAMLETAQTYLSQLVQLEQWAASYGMDAAQFEASLAQWQAEYDMAMKKFGYQQERDKVSDAQWQYSQTASMGEALLDAGMMPSDAQLAAMGLTKAQAQQWIIAAQLKAAQEDTGKTTYSTTDELYQALKAAGVTTGEGALAQLTAWGVTSPNNYTDAYTKWYKDNKPEAEPEKTTEYRIVEYKVLSDGYTNSQKLGELEFAFQNGLITEAEYIELAERAGL